MNKIIDLYDIKKKDINVFSQIVLFYNNLKVN